MSNKAVKLDYSDGDGDLYNLYQLSDKNAIHLISSLIYFYWSTRWDNPPDTDTLQSYVSELEYNLMTPINFCEYMIDCIESNEGVKNALEQWFDNTSYNQLLQFVANNYGTSVVGSGNTSDCNDNVFAMIYALHDEIHTRNTDFIESIEAYTNTFELLGDFAEELTLAVSAVTGFGGVLAGALTYGSQLIDYILETLADAYNAEYTATLRDTIACDLFCIARNTCKLSIDDMYNYHLEQLSLSESLSIDQLFLSVISGQWQGSEIVHIMYILQLGFAKLSDAGLWIVSDFAHAVSNRYKLVLESASDEINNDWGVLCDCGIISTLFVTFDDGTYDQYTLSGTGTGNNTPRISNQGSPNFNQAYAGSVNGSYEIRVTVDLLGSYEVSQIDFDRRTYQYGEYELVGIKPDDSTIVLRSGSGSTNEPSYETIATPITPMLLKGFYVRWYGGGSGSRWAFLDNIECDVKDYP
jgi:hypothetical protein